jgi:tripartite-type tricarboxylate transporter receptor subunit TctC
MIRNIANGDVIGIAIAGDERSKVMPTVPTFAESGYPDFHASSWVGFFVPAGTPPAIVEKLNDEINAVMREDETRKVMEASGLDIFIRDRAATSAFFSAEVANWAKMINATGITQ